MHTITSAASHMQVLKSTGNQQAALAPSLHCVAHTVGFLQPCLGLVRQACQSKGRPRSTPWPTSVQSHLGCCRHLDLAGNRLTSLGSLSALPVLHTLLLSGNLVSSLSDCAPEAFGHLEVLDISCNAVEPQQVAVLGHFPQLRQLDVSGGRPFSVLSVVLPRAVSG